MCGAILAAFLALTCTAAAAAPVVDDRGKAFDDATPARRIVALAPHLAELLFDLGAGAALVGAVRGADHPPAAARTAKVGDAAGIDLERVLALQPDLVLAWGSGNRASDLARLEALGLRVFVNEPRVLADVGTTLRRLGHLSGRARDGENAAVAFETALAALQVPGGSAVPAFVQIWDRPLMSVSGTHLISQALHHCGGRNVFAGLPALVGSVSREAVLSARPALILVLAPPAKAHEWARAWSAFANTNARAVVALDPDVLTRATPRLLRGVEQLCAAIAAVRRGSNRANATAGTRQGSSE